MKKQIIYSKFMPRLFALTIDLMVISIFILPIVSFISKYFFVYIFQDFFASNNIDTSNKEAVLSALNSSEFVNFMTLPNITLYIVSLLSINAICLGIYFVLLNYKLGATVGKFLMRIKIVNKGDYKKPTLFQFIKRFIGYITILIGGWSIFFNKERQTTHDKIAGTVVIKS